jgi:protein subunit release factor A
MFKTKLSTLVNFGIQEKEAYMEKNKGKWIKEENLKIETDRYYSQDEVRHEVVKLTYIPSNISVTFDSITGQVYAYNRALELLEKKIFDNVNKIICGID